MEIIKGYVEKIIFRNSDNGYTVLNVVMDDDEITCVGVFHYVNEGEFVELKGTYKSHNLYGEQFQVEKYEIKAPDNIISIERYLSSGAIKGIGESLAKRIVKKFGEDTFRIIEEEPERLSEIKGISERKAMEIASYTQEKADMRDAMIFLQRYGISVNMAVKIYNFYGEKIYTVMRENPYKLADDIFGIGFKAADSIAKEAGINPDSEFRIKSGILFTLQKASGNGHIYLPYEDLKAQAEELLGIPDMEFEKNLMDLAVEKRVVIKGEDRCVYAANFYFTELNIAKMLHDLNIKSDHFDDKVDRKIEQIENETGIKLDEIQKKAVKASIQSGLLIITGGPGTGKTTTINTIIKYFEKEGMDIFLAAPTGRAAKRMTEATGYESQTIHRILELSGELGDTSSGAKFERNEENPLEADVIIIDETSMVDMFLMSSLLKAVCVGTRLILVGDVDQLPSVGPGNILKDIIDSEVFEVVMLEKIFRQASESDIIVNAHRINRGEKISLDNNSKDFLFLSRDDSNKVVNATITLLKEKLPTYVNASPFDIQILTPMRKGLLGVEKLNEIIQMYINPPEESKREKDYHGTIFREGDKVMQIKNNYQVEWEIRGSYGVVHERGMGIFNGDIGIIKNINVFSEYMEIVFDENKYVNYSFNSLDELELAYAVTVHKSQGSEYPAVILPILSGPYMLMNRNILYTAVTRAKNCVCIVGSSDTIQDMIDQPIINKRYSKLSERIKECY